MFNPLPIEAFGSHLLRTLDLDPIYLALHRLKLEDAQLSRWLVAYWCFYHAGFACYAAEQSDENFWPTLLTAAENKSSAPTGGRWPRGSERRHFRGEQGIKAVTELRDRFKTASDVIDMVTERSLKYGSPVEDQPIPAGRIMKNVQKLRGFGPWIAFKVADMVDRLGVEDVSFDQAAVFMFKDPVEGAKRLYERVGVARMGEPPEATEQTKIDWAIKYITDHLGQELAPPRFERRIGLQEIETILCKWKSHTNKHYPLGKDTREIREGLKEWNVVSPLASRFFLTMPEEV